MNIRKNIISIILISLGILLPIKEKYDYHIYKLKEEKEINNYINNKESNYLLILEIPKLSLKKGIYKINSKENNLDKEVIILNSSNLSNNTIFLASHSGTNKNAYFNDLIYLKINDTINIYLNNKKYIYGVSNIKYIEKKGYLEINNNIENTLTLITCSTKYKDKQLIITANLLE